MANSSEMKEILGTIGLTPIETEIIEILVTKKVVSVTDLAKLIRTPRSSIYRHLTNLEKHGLIKYRMNLQGKEIELGDFSQIQSALVEEQENIIEKQTSLSSLIKNLNVHRTESETPIVRYYEGKAGLRQIYWNTMYAQDLVRVFTSVVRRRLVGDKWLENHLIEFSKKNVKARILGDEEYAKFAYEEYESREKYYGPAADLAFQFDERIVKSTGFNLKGEVLVYDNIVAFHSVDEGKIVGTEFESAHMAITMRSLFDFIWSTTTEKDRIENSRS